MQITIYWFELTFILWQWCYAQQDPEVDIKYGRVRGQTVYLSSGLGINTFLGVPYAKAPLGDLRFEAPIEPDPWEDTLNASRAGNACIQKIFFTVNLTHNGWTRYSEDCLNLNIYAPQNSSNLPVLVYIHGGSFYEGANIGGPGYFQAQDDVVAVSVNYRLGILGFAYTGDDTIPGNNGIRDLVQSLTFIQENIAAFGGDPSRVTISGESAGGALVGFLMMSPLAAGLFHGAILQSGNDLVPFGLLEPETNPEKYIFILAEDFNCPISSTELMISCLREIDAKTLMEVNISCTPGYQCIGFQPLVDGEVLPDTPLNLRNNGHYNKVPEIIGLTQDEFNLFIPVFFPDIVAGLSRTDFDKILYNETAYRLLKYPNTTREDDVFQAFRFYYADWPYFDDPISNRDMIGKIYTDESYGYPSDFQAKSHSSDGSDVYFYVYDYRMSNTYLPEWMGTVHAMDLNPQFGWPFMEDNMGVFNHSEANPMFSVTNYTKTDKELSSLFMTLWTNFAKFGNPTPEPVLGPDNTEVVWSAFSNEQLNYLDIKAEPEIKQNYRQKDYAFWNEYVNYLVNGNEFIKKL